MWRKTLVFASFMCLSGQGRRAEGELGQGSGVCVPPVIAKTIGGKLAAFLYYFFASWATLEAILVSFWGRPEPFWRLGNPSGWRRASWRGLGALWEPSGGRRGAILGRLGRPLGPSWAILEPSGAVLGPSWGHLGPSWGHLGPSWDPLGALEGPPGATVAF